MVDRYLGLGVAASFILITFGVGTAMLLERALRLIYDLAARGADLGYFFPILVTFLPYYLDLALPAAFTVALILLVARLDDNLELEAMLASGLSLSRLVLPLVAFGLLIGALSLVTSGWLEPHGQYRMRSLRVEAVNAARIGRLAPGAIYHPGDQLALTFDQRGANGAVQKIFLWQRLGDGRELVLTGASAQIGFDPARGFFLIAIEGGRYAAWRPAARAADALAFGRLDFRETLRLEEEHWQRGWDVNEMTMSELAAAVCSGHPRIHPAKLEGELYARIGRAALIPLIPLLVLPLVFTTKKGRRGLNTFLVLVLVALFHHGMNLARHLAFAEAVPALPAILVAGGLFALAASFVFAAGRKLPSGGPIHSWLQRVPVAWAGRRRAGGRSLPVQRTLAAYVSGRMAGWTLASLVGIVLLLQMVDLLERGDQFVERGRGFAGVVQHLILQLPLMLQQAAPIAALAGAMTVFTGLARAGEMTAIRAAGVSQWRLLLMAAPVPLLLAGSTFVLSEYFVPQSQVRLATWWGQSEPPPAVTTRSARWFRIGDEIVRAGGSTADGTILRDLVVFRRDSNGLLVERLTAARAIVTEGTWVLHDVDRNRLGRGSGASERMAQLAWPVALRPDDVSAFFTSTRSLSSAAARRALGEAAPVNQSETLFATRVLRSGAEPLAPIVMLLLALPLAFVSSRPGASWPAFLYAAGGGLFYLVADGVLTVFAEVGYLPPAVGAWTAPAVALLTAFTVLLYAER